MIAASFKTTIKGSVSTAVDGENLSLNVSAIVSNSSYIAAKSLFVYDLLEISNSLCKRHV